MALDAKERDSLIRRYANGPALLRRAFAKVPAAALKWRPAPGEWSAHEVVCHCADSETNSYARIRFVVAEPSPVIQGYDQERWALIRRLADDAWQRVGTHTESGPYGAEEWLRIYAEHLEIHARQIDANVAAWRASHPKKASRANRGRASGRPKTRSPRRRSA